MFIMRLYKAKKIRKAIPNTFQIHTFLPFLPPQLTGLEMSHRQFFWVAEHPPTTLGDSCRALCAWVLFWKAHCFWGQILNKKRDFPSATTYDVHSASSDACPKKSRSQLMSDTRPLCYVSVGVWHWPATCGQPALKHCSPDLLPSDTQKFCTGWVTDTKLSRNQWHLQSRVPLTIKTYPHRKWLLARLYCWYCGLHWRQR